MVAGTKFNAFVRDEMDGVHKFNADTFKMLLSNSAPVNTNAVKSDITEISAGNGYSAGGPSLVVTRSTSGGTTRAIAADVTLTASGGSIGPFRYVAIYNDTPTSPADPLVQFYDIGSSVTLASGDSFVFDFDNTNGFLSQS